MLEAVLRNILAHFIGIKYFAVHGDIHTGLFTLHRAYGAANIEYGVTAGESRGLQRAGENNTFICNVCQGRRCGNHPIGAVGYEYTVLVTITGELANQFSICVCHIKAVFAHCRFHCKGKADLHFFKQLTDHWLSNLIITLGVEVDFVDGAAGGDDM